MRIAHQQLRRIGDRRQRDDAVLCGERYDARLFDDARFDVLEIVLQLELAVHFPVERGTDELAVAAVAVDRRLDVFVHRVDADAELVVLSEAPGEVDCDTIRTVRVGERRHARDGLRARPLHDHVDDAGWNGEAVVERRRALQHFDALLVFHRHPDVVVDRQDAVDVVARAVVERDAADRQIVVRETVQLQAGYAGDVAQRVVETGIALGVHHVARHHVDSRRHVERVETFVGAGFDA